MAVLAALLVMGHFAPRATADPFGIQAFDGELTAGPIPDPTPNPGTPTDIANFPPAYTQAGGHPFALITQIRLNRNPDPVNGDIWPSEPLKDTVVSVPPGFIGNPTVLQKCTMSELTGNGATTGGSECPIGTQVGVLLLETPVCLAVDNCTVKTTVGQMPLYEMEPPPGVPARFAADLAGTIVTLDAGVNAQPDGSYTLSVSSRNASEGLPIAGLMVTLWGTPDDPAHDSERACPGAPPPSQNGPHCAITTEPKAFLTLPTTCAGPMTTTLLVDSWFHPNDVRSATYASHQPPGLPLLDPPVNAPETALLPPDQWGAPQGPTGCDQVPFSAAFSARPDAATSPGPSGWTFDLTMPQDGLTAPGLIDPHTGLIDPNSGIAGAALKRTTVTLPEGVSVSPSSAGGLAACSPSQIGLGSDAVPTCPDASKIATVQADTPLLDTPLTGAIYLATPFDNPSHSLLAIYLVLEGSGVVVKLPSAIAPDPSTGRISATFDNIPQLPFSHLHIAFFGGPRAALSNPPRCGTYTTTATLTSWNDQTITSNSSFTTSADGNGAPCPAPRFAPTLSAGTSGPNGDAPIAGSSSRFSLTLSRQDQDDQLAAIEHTNLPQGLLAKIAGVPLCAAAQVAAGTCAESSRIGSVTTSAGPGPDPFAVSGRVYIGGPYKGAPFSLSIVVPVVAGPFDLGTVVVRSALFIDRHTAQLDARTDPLPTILQGIPLQVRTVNLTIDRKGFIVNPTSCDPTRIGATARSVTGLLAHPSTRFQVAGCAGLPFRPHLSLSVGSKGHTQHGRSVPLTATLTQGPGQAGLKSVAVTLPLSLNATLGVVNRACTQAQFDAGHCQQAKAGTAVAVTRLLPHALRGGVYFVKDPKAKRGALPNLIVALRGQIAFDLVGKIKIPGGTRLSTRFTTAPDAPIRSFTLRFAAGRNSPLGAAANLCGTSAKRAVAQIAIRGQNGDLIRTDQRLTVHGCSRGRRR